MEQGDIEWLVKHAASWLSEWEKQSLPDVLKRSHWPLTDKQRNVIEKMREK